MYGMNVAIVAVGCLGRQAVLRQARDELRGELDRVDHAALGVARVRVESLERDRHRIGGEALPFELAGVAAIDRVGADRAEAADVEVVRAASDLFVRREADADRAVRDLGMLHQVLAAATISATPALSSAPRSVSARGRDDVVAGVRGERRILGGAQNGRRIVGQHQIAAVVLAVDDRLDLVALHLRRRVDVGDEADDRHVQLARRRRDGRHHVAVLVHGDVGEADGRQLVDEHAQQRRAARACSDTTSSPRRSCVLMTT